jgi:hypothetical protein
MYPFGSLIADQIPGFGNLTIGVDRWRIAPFL